MSAPFGNRFWEKRSKDGREKLFSDSTLLWESACEYFLFVDENPYLVQEQRKGQVNLKIDAKLEADALADIAEALKPLISIPTIRPYTLAGLCVFLGASRSWWNAFKGSADEDFLEVIARIEEIIYVQKFEGAAVGAFNANLISRELGLADKQSIDMSTDITVEYTGSEE